MRGFALAALAVVVALVALGPGVPAVARDVDAGLHAVSVDIDVTLPQLAVFDPLAPAAGDPDSGWSGEFDSARAAAVATVNGEIRRRALAMIAELSGIGNVWGGHEVHVHRGDLISVTMHYSGYMPPMAHPAHLRAAVTANPATGEIYTLRDLFADERYISVLSEAVRRGIEDQGIPLLVEFTGIDPDHEFYLTHDSLVLYYQTYELAPYAWGFPEFAIPLYELEPIAKSDGPIMRLLYGE